MDKQPIPDFLPEKLPEKGPEEMPPKPPKIPKGLIEALRESGAPQEVIDAVTSGNAEIVYGGTIDESEVPPEARERFRALRITEQMMLAQAKRWGLNPNDQTKREDLFVNGCKTILDCGPKIDKVLAGAYEDLMKAFNGDVAMAALSVSTIYSGISARLKMEATARRVESLLGQLAGEAGKHEGEPGPFPVEHIRDLAQKLGNSKDSLRPPNVVKGIKKLGE